MSKKSEIIKDKLSNQLLKLTEQKCLYFFRFFTRWYLKLRFVSNTFWTEIPKSSHCDPMKKVLRVINYPLQFNKKSI